MTANEFIGKDFEEAYAKAFQGSVIGGIGDNGKDVSVPGFGFVQIKASLHGAMNFLKESLKRHEFIPVCIGEPGDCDEMIKSLKTFGAWVGMEIHSRKDILQKISVVRSYCRN